MDLVISAHSYIRVAPPSAAAASCHNSIRQAFKHLAQLTRNTEVRPTLISDNIKVWEDFYDSSSQWIQTFCAKVSSM